MDSVIHISDDLYKVVVREAAARQRSPDKFAEEMLARQLLPEHPYVERIESRSGMRAVIRSTRVGVDVIVGYWQAGYAPEEIATEILPHLTLAQVYDALSYFHDHTAEIKESLSAHTVEAWQERLKKRLGEPAYARLTGEAAGA